MAAQKISPQYFTSKLEGRPTIEDYIDVYQDQVFGWYLKHAIEMHGDEHAGFAALQVIFSYFEGHAIFYRGESSENRSKKFFKESFLHPRRMSVLRFPPSPLQLVTLPAASLTSM